MKTKMIVVVVLAAMCVLPLSAQVKVGVEDVYKRQCTVL